MSAILRTTLFTASLIYASATFTADGYPTKPVRYVVPSAPGGNADALARILAERLTKSFGQQVLVENRPGGSNIVATELVVKAPPDGHTLLQIANAHFTNPTIFRQLPYDTTRDLAPVSLLASTPLVMVAHPSVPARNVKDLIALARARPGELNYHSSGVGTSGHLAGALLASLAHINLVPVPYRGTAQAMTDVVSGDLHCAFPSLTVGLPFVKVGKLRALGVTGSKRTPLAPQLATISESGLPGYEASIWNGLLVPARTPREMIGRLNSEIIRVLTAPEIRQQLANTGSDAASSSPEEFGAFVDAEIRRWAPIIKAAGITPQ